MRNVQLCHVDSLKDFLYLVRAMRMINNGQNPFEQVKKITHKIREIL